MHEVRLTPARDALGRWHAEPMDAGQATRLLAQAQLTARRMHQQSAPAIAAQLKLMIARFWLGRPIETQYRTLLEVCADDIECALVELVTGQLQISRRMPGALGHLQRAFELGRDAMRARDYFVVFRRLQLLAFLPPHPIPAPPATLSSLLHEARVIQRLYQSGRHFRPPRRHLPADTVG